MGTVHPNWYCPYLGRPLWERRRNLQVWNVRPTWHQETHHFTQILAHARIGERQTLANGLWTQETWAFLRLLHNPESGWHPWSCRPLQWCSLHHRQVGISVTIQLLGLTRGHLRFAHGRWGLVTSSDPTQIRDSGLTQFILIRYIVIKIQQIWWPGLDFFFFSFPPDNYWLKNGIALCHEYLSGDISYLYFLFKRVYLSSKARETRFKLM